MADIPRLVKIRKRAEPRVAKLFTDAGLTYPCPSLMLRAFKHDAQLELWGAAHRGDAMTLVQTYPICAPSGELGPKREQGDEQVPEGCYTIHRYNAWSGFHLSMRVDYPNASDRARGNRWNLGGAIIVHGGCATIGCIPIENEPIEEVFLASLDARRAGRHDTPIHILPTRLDADAMAMLRTHPHATPDRIELWEELQPIFEELERTHRVPSVEIDPKTGAYGLVPATMPIG